MPGLRDRGGRYERRRLLTLPFLHRGYVRIGEAAVEHTRDAAQRIAVGARQLAVIAQLLKDLILFARHAALVLHARVRYEVVQVGVTAAETVPADDFLKDEEKVNNPILSNGEAVERERKRCKRARVVFVVLANFCFACLGSLA